jgi:hypothetical protein
VRDSGAPFKRRRILHSARESLMSNTPGSFQRLVEWLTEALERAQTHDRDRYVEQSLNAREASQRIHRIEHETSGLQC